MTWALGSFLKYLRVGCIGMRTIIANRHSRKTQFFFNTSMSKTVEYKVCSLNNGPYDNGGFLSQKRPIYTNCIPLSIQFCCFKLIIKLFPRYLMLGVEL